MPRHLSPPVARLAALLGSAFASVAVVAADVYQWTDEHGNTHFGDRAPATGARQIRVPTGSTHADAGRQERTQRLLDEFATARAEKKASAAERARAAEERAAACDEARNRHYEYEHSGYLYVWDDKGNKRVLSDEEHRQARETARADVENWCD